MFGLEPRDEARPDVVLQLPKTNEGVHLVTVAPDVTREAFDAADERICPILQRLRLIEQS